MKVSKIPGLGSYGAFVDGIDFNHISDEEWQEVGKLHQKTLVTIIRNTQLSPEEYLRRISQWGTPRDLQEYRMTKKYNTWCSELFRRVRDNQIEGIDPDDVPFLKSSANVLRWKGNSPMPIINISGKKDEKGNPLGMFAEGELLWHSNESGNLAFTPQVSFYGYKNVVGSATGFVTTADWYEEQTESFRSELDEMVILHKFTPGKINPGLRDEQDNNVYRNMCPVDGTEIPLVITSPGGIKGLHYSPNTIGSIKGMTQAESDRIFKIIDDGIFNDKFIYDHWYQQDTDLCLFDNSITQHRRLGDIKERLGLRIQYDFDTALDTPYMPYKQEPYKSRYLEEIKDVISVLQLKKYKLPAV